MSDKPEFMREATAEEQATVIELQRSLTLAMVLWCKEHDRTQISADLVVNAHASAIIDAIDGCPDEERRARMLASVLHFIMTETDVSFEKAADCLNVMLDHERDEVMKAMGVAGNA